MSTKTNDELIADLTRAKAEYEEACLATGLRLMAHQRAVKDEEAAYERVSAAVAAIHDATDPDN